MKQGMPGVPSWQDYVTKHLPVHASVGIDPSVINVAQAKQLEDDLAAKGSRLVYTETNLVDQVRERVPERPHESIKRHPLEYAGKSARNKLQELRQALKGKCSVLSRLDEIAWLFNLRGSDIHCCPVFFSYCLITPDKAFLYVQKDVMEDKIRTELEQLGIEIRKYDDIVSDLLTFDHTMFSVDPDGTNMSILQALNRNSNQIDLEPSPVQLLKAIKNPTELKGLRDCHKWDAAALCRHFAWLSEKISKQEQVWEIEAAEHLDDMRRCHPLYVGPSFDTIAASGPNGAIIHYSPTHQDCSKIDPFELYLCDSGGHYLNGTTDVTRTYLFSGEPSLFQKRAFTRVLQAHIAIDQAIFPEGVTGYQLDSVARQPLWKDGLDFRHGVGHGVGAYLNVHEGPHGIGSRKAYDQVPLQAGMIVTNEPGYYKDRQFGIRIENVLHDGLPFETVPEKDELGPLSQNVTILTLAQYLLGNEKYGRGAANLIRVHFLNEYAVEDEDEYNSARRIPDDSHLLDFLSDQGYSFPSLSRVPHVVPKYSNSRILNTSDLTKTDLSSLLDCIRLLRKMQVLTHKEYIDLQAITAEFLEYLVTSPTGIHLAQMTDHRGVLYDLQVTAMAAFTDDVRLFLRVANRCRMRIGKQFKEDGTQPYEETSTRTRLLSSGSSDHQVEWRALLHYQTLNLQYWTLLARGIQNAGIAKDIWHYTAANEGQISHAVVRHLQTYADALPTLSPADADFARSRLRPLAYMAQAAFRHSHEKKTPIDGRVKARTEQDREWIERHVSLFGDQWSAEPLEEEELVHDILKIMHDDKIKGRLGVPPFWMLTSTNS
ncbi:Putative Aminopeptidase P [Rhizopus microsporus]|nr:Putative Aminopeptidase P [Rhizopus microsporus]